MRTASVALLSWMLWASIAPRGRIPRARAEVSAAGLDTALARWSSGAVPDTIHLVADRLPRPDQRDWLAALAAAGAQVAWTPGPAVLPTALEVEPESDPRGGVRILLAAPPGMSAFLADRIGPLDSADVRAHGATWRVPALEGPAEVTGGGALAAAIRRDSLAPRPVLVLGRAGWEAKFLIAALEERGWVVSARLRVAPTVEVTQGDLGPIDTARYAAVVALDTSAARYAREITAYARRGGGVVIAGNAGDVPAIAALASGPTAGRQRAAALSFAAATPRRALAFFAISHIKRDAIVLESREGAVAAAARREGTGRVVQVGYDETWRWRLAGGDGAPDAHRAWWSAVVSSAAYRPAVPLAAPDTLRSAPFAQTVARLGPPAPAPARPGSEPGSRGLRLWMLALLFALLVGEWGSRRLRGAP